MRTTIILPAHNEELAIASTISDIREIVEEFGNWRVETRMSSTGRTQYFMKDTHPGRRMFKFRADGTRYKTR